MVKNPQLLQPLAVAMEEVHFGINENCDILALEGK